MSELQADKLWLIELRLSGLLQALKYNGIIYKDCLLIYVLQKIQQRSYVILADKIGFWAAENYNLALDWPFEQCSMEIWSNLNPIDKICGS